MLTTAAPDRDLLVDHRGRSRVSVPSGLTHDQALLGTAFHEAGHAVLALVHGMHLMSSEVVVWLSAPGQSTVTGRTSCSAARIEDVHPWRFAAQAAAGSLAQVRYLMDYGLWTPGRAAACPGTHDRDHAVDVLAGMGYQLGVGHIPAGGKSWGQVRGMAWRRVDRLWPQIRIVAHAMYEHTRLTGEEIAAMTGLVNAPMPAGEVA
ncbi:hypothetical protein OOK39_11905 [Streptomyces sp. NBC_00264]|uniref:hypothetical protein n=1 Tax=unclassified Streptomyces TaxID=2593676 RepID=UPI002256C7B9|nr:MULTISPECIES: hypothetical protein [unclassified Streptomyces]MCX5159977.1 hypothetical protein [Streptomyces sp. NBC_00305]MCX5218500.1 hypothetical protein [Streptomyces sp. NBC_00264]